MAKNKFLNLIFFKIISWPSTLEHSYTQILSDQHLQYAVILDRSYLPADTKVSDTEYPPFGAEQRRQIARDHMAQSSVKTPLGVPPFWDSGANPTTERNTWFGTLKMAIMARDNLQVDKLLKLKPARTELPYPTIPTYEEPFDGKTEDEERQRDQRNERRKVDWENECKKLKQNGPMIDKLPWDEADLKVKSLIYLSLGVEGTRTFHQRNPHTKIERCSTNELVHELTLTFTRPRNRTFDRFQCFKTMQQPNESFETFYSRLREQGAHCKFEHLEEDLIKDIFISNMRSSNIQMELLSETRSPQQALNYAVNRERGLANQQQILRSNNRNWNTVSYVRTNRQRTHNQNTQQKQNPCWKCGGTFSLAHLQTCPAKATTCKICKKPGHYTSLCTAKMPERRPQNTPQSSSAQNYKQPKTRRIRNINQEEIESEQLEESVDAEAALYIKHI